MTWPRRSTNDSGVETMLVGVASREPGGDGGSSSSQTSNESRGSGKAGRGVNSAVWEHGGVPWESWNEPGDGPAQ